MRIQGLGDVEKRREREKKGREGRKGVDP